MKILLTLSLIKLVLGLGPYCCAPDQWEGTINMLQGYATPGHPPGAETGTIQTHFDFTNQRVVSFSTISVDGVHTVFHVIKDYKQSAQFTFHPDSNTCEKTTLAYPLARTCPPYTATKLAPEMYGGGKDQAMVDRYLLVNPSFNETFRFTSEKCLPFSRMLWGTLSGDPIMQIYMYTNLTIGIRDPSVFNLPPACSKL